MDIERLKCNLSKVKSNIVRACDRVGRNPVDVKLIVVTKSVPVEVMNVLDEFGIIDIGENRVQEAMEKYPKIVKNYRWNMVGTLQTNKVKKALELFKVIHSIDRPKLVNELGKFHIPIDAFIQVNVTAESTKHGVEPQEVNSLVSMIRSEYNHINLLGLMTMAPVNGDSEAVRGCFSKLRELRDSSGLTHLSMGMSQDYQIACEEGATYLRIGTAIFEGVF